MQIAIRGPHHIRIENLTALMTVTTPNTFTSN